MTAQCTPPGTAASATAAGSGTGWPTGRRHPLPASRRDNSPLPGIRSDVDAFARNGLAFGHVEAAAVDRTFAGGRAGILHNENLSAGFGAEFAFEVRVGMEQHRPGTMQRSVDRE